MSIQLEISRHYLGTAQVRLPNLRYSSSSTEPDDCVGCCLSDLEHNLPALVSYAEYMTYLSNAGISLNALFAVGRAPRLALPSDVQLPCLHGHFRLEIAKRDEPQSEDEWWLVDLYSSGKKTARLPIVSC